MDNNQPFISLVVPVRNESAYILKTLEAILAQDYPSQRMEVLVADGMSDDGTREMVAEFAADHSNIHLVDNPKRIVPTGLNTAILKAGGDVIVRMDSHSVYPANYLTTLVTALRTYDCHNVGCLIETKPADQSLAAKAIAVALSHPFGVGNAWFRIGTNEVKEVDTVPFGCFRREVFDKIGLFDEELVRNQDDEFNARMIKNGLKIVLIPNLVVSYYARATYGKLFKMYYQYGLFKPLVNLKLKRIATVRQLVPALLVGYLLSTLLLGLFFPFAWLFFVSGALIYLAGLTVVGLGARPINEPVAIAGHIVWAMATLHVSYGWGYLKGIVSLLFRHRLAKTGNSTSR
ncbi:MAG: glycosyltransferase family 2 protein [Breznakibacter sp.]